MLCHLWYSLLLQCMDVNKKILCVSGKDENNRTAAIWASLGLFIPLKLKLHVHVKLYLT